MKSYYWDRESNNSESSKRLRKYKYWVDNNDGNEEKGRFRAESQQRCFLFRKDLRSKYKNST